MAFLETGLPVNPGEQLPPVDQLLFTAARTPNAWTEQGVDPELIYQAYELAKFGPTSSNTSPARFVFITSEEGKERLRPLLAPGNVAKSMTAPVVAIIAQDMAFYEKAEIFFPDRADMIKTAFAGNAELVEDTAFRNSSLQGAYLMLALRLLGLDCGPISGFSRAGVDQAFFAGTEIRSNFLCNIGYGAAEGIYPRNPRLSFEQACWMA